MKLILTLALLVSTGVCAQTRSDVKLYGYVQPVTGGANPIEMPDESGSNPSKPAARENYYIYISGPAGQRIYPTEVWIRGQQYSTRTTSVKSPVELTIETGETNPKKKVLVSRTSNGVYHVTPAAGTPAKVLAVSEIKSADNELVITYKLGSKMYYAVLKKLLPLDPAAMQ